MYRARKTERLLMAALVSQARPFSWELLRCAGAGCNTAAVIFPTPTAAGIHTDGIAGAIPITAGTGGGHHATPVVLPAPTVAGCRGSVTAVGITVRRRAAAAGTAARTTAAAKDGGFARRVANTVGVIDQQVAPGGKAACIKVGDHIQC